MSSPAGEKGKKKREKLWGVESLSREPGAALLDVKFQRFDDAPGRSSITVHNIYIINFVKYITYMFQYVDVNTLFFQKKNKFFWTRKYSLHYCDCVASATAAGWQSLSAAVKTRIGTLPVNVR
jgi:hypothetical protein